MFLHVVHIIISHSTLNIWQLFKLEGTDGIEQIKLIKVVWENVSPLMLESLIIHVLEV